MSDVFGSPTTHPGRPNDRARQCPSASKSRRFGERVMAGDAHRASPWRLFETVPRRSFGGVSADAWESARAFRLGSSKDPAGRELDTRAWFPKVDVKHSTLSLSPTETS